MKILITGMNSAQTIENFYLRQQIKLASHVSILACLRDMGHTVEQRAVAYDETLSEYDKVIVYIHNPAGFAGQVFPALTAIAKRPDAIIAIDDWQTDSIWEGSTTDGPRMFRARIEDCQPPGWDVGMVNAGIASLKSKTHKVLVPAFKGGNITQLIPGGYDPSLIFSYNPNPYHLNNKNTVAPEDKLKAFNFASLVQGKTAKWLKQNSPKKWDLFLYGSKKDKQLRLTDEEMCKVFAQQWGSLLPGYWHDTSGWWRFRHLQLADAGSILIGNPNELSIIYKDQALASLSVSQVEDMDLTQLIATANGQREAIYAAHPLDKAVERQELDTVLNA